MKSVYACLVVFLIAIALPGCNTAEPSLAEEDLTADDFAQYEADLAAANSEGTYDEDNDENE